MATNADFAAGIARAEFGRFYWNATLERPAQGRHGEAVQARSQAAAVKRGLRQHAFRSGRAYWRVGSTGAVREDGVNSTHAAAPRTSVKPITSGIVGRSPRTSIEATMPITGALNTPSEAVMAGSRRTIANHSR